MKKLFGLFLTLALACCLCFALTACGDESEGSGAPTVEISEDGYWVINGEKTEVKAQGEKGEKGDTGAQGEKGDKGDTGATGAQGPQGEKGDKGDTGATGAQGPQGEKGDTGEKGEDGKDFTPVDENPQGLAFFLKDDGTYVVAAGYAKYLSKIEIPATYKGKAVTEIGEMGFVGCTYLAEIVIPNSVKSIGYDAFVDCESLTSVTIGNGVTSIGYEAFSGCISLTSITIPDNVTSIGDSAFSSCTNLTSLTIGDSLTSIGSYAFSGCPIENATLPAIAISSIPKGKLKTVVITSGDSIGEWAFYNCSSLESITIPDSVTSIGDCAFLDCTSLESITIPDSVTSIGYAAFWGCTSLANVTTGDGVTSIGIVAFYSCTSLISVTIGNSVTSIGEFAFYNCSSLASITANEGNTAYKDIDENLYTKDGKTLIQYAIGKTDTSFIIPDSVTSIGFAAFSSCTSLTSITIPDSVRSIGDCAFSDCTSLTIYCVATAKPDGWTSSWNDYGCPVVWDCNNKEIADDGNIYAVIDGIRYALKDNTAKVTYQSTSIVTADIPATVTYKDVVYNVTSIGNSAFGDCRSLTSVTIPDSVTSIAYAAFENCSSLISIEVNAQNIAYKDIDGNLYTEDGKTLIQYAIGKTDTSFTIPDSVTSISDSAFYNCTSLTSITIPDSVTSIGDSAFSNCPIETATLPAIAISSIPKGKLKTVVITSGDSIGGQAFAACTSLESITIPDSVTSIGVSAFWGCTSLADVYYTASMEKWNEISIDFGNECLTGATIHYNYTE